MKTFFALPLLLFCFTASAQQTDSLPPLDKSPLDMSYCPDGYPLLKTQRKTVSAPIARVIYGRPGVNNRSIFGGLVEYGQVWRLGANEATEVEFFQNVIIGKKTVKKGRYTLYAIPQSDAWTFVLNKQLDVWGAFNYSQALDVARVTAPVQNRKDPVENLAMVFEKSGNKSFNLSVYWDKVKVSLPISLP